MMDARSNTVQVNIAKASFLNEAIIHNILPIILKYMYISSTKITNKSSQIT